MTTGMEVLVYLRSPWDTLIPGWTGGVPSNGDRVVLRVEGDAGKNQHLEGVVIGRIWETRSKYENAGGRVKSNHRRECVVYVDWKVIITDEEDP